MIYLSTFLEFASIWWLSRSVCSVSTWWCLAIRAVEHFRFPTGSVLCSHHVGDRPRGAWFKKWWENWTWMVKIAENFGNELVQILSLFLRIPVLVPLALYWISIPGRSANFDICRLIQETLMTSELDTDIVWVYTHRYSICNAYALYIIIQCSHQLHSSAMLRYAPPQVNFPGQIDNPPYQALP